MSWLFSQALVVEFSAGICSDGAQFAQLNVMPTQRPFWHKDKTIEPSRLSRFGLTSRALTAAHGAALLTWYLADSRVRTSATAGKRKALKATVADSGKSRHASFARFDRDSHSWKTSQRCLVEEWESFSQTWPRWGLMLDGECWELPTLAATRPEKGYGLWPTLKASDGEQRTKNLRYFERRLTIAPDLPVIVALSTPPTQKGFYGRLNPDWCEWLMTWPVKWTALEPLETGKTQEWLQQHSAYCQAQQIQTGEK